MRIPKFYILFFACMFLSNLACFAGIQGATSKLINQPEYYFYAPDGIQDLVSCPLIVAFSPSGNGRRLVDFWSGIAKEYECCLFASKVIKNGMDIPTHLKRIREIIRTELPKTYPIRTDCIIAVGVSGGGMASHLFSFFWPDTVAAVISNVGYIHENSLKRKSEYPKGKVCVFLTGPKDFNYPLMKEDRKYLNSLDWTTKWTEFPGGHKRAPAHLFKESLEWILEQDYIKDKLK